MIFLAIDHSDTGSLIGLPIGRWLTMFTTSKRTVYSSKGVNKLGLFQTSHFACVEYNSYYIRPN